MKKQNKMVAVMSAMFALAGCGTTDVSANRSASGTDAKPAGIGSFFSGSHQVTIPAGTILKIRTSTTLSTHTAKTGETAPATLDQPVMISGSMLVPRGAEATLLVADSDPGGRVKGRAQIGLRLTSLQVAGTTKPLMTDIVWHQAHATKRKDAAKIGILTGIGAAIGALGGGGKGAAIGAGAGAGAGTAVVLSTHGDPAIVSAESVIQFRLEQPLTFTVRG